MAPLGARAAVAGCRPVPVTAALWRLTLHIGHMSRTNKTLKSLLYKYIYILFIYSEKVHIINTGKGG